MTRAVNVITGAENEQVEVENGGSQDRAVLLRRRRLIINTNVRGGLGVVEVEVEPLGREIDGLVGGDGFGGRKAFLGAGDGAGEGGFDLAAFPHVTDWLARVRAQPGFVPMPGVSDEVAVRLASS